MRRLILRSHQSPGDILMLTAAVRELHRAYPGQYQSDVRTSAPALWDHNPHLTPLSESDGDVTQLEMHYPLIHHSNERPYHFLHGYLQHLESQLNIKLPATRFAGDIYLSPEERSHPPTFAGVDLPRPFWIVVAGGKYDFTSKWWNPASYQAVVDHFAGKLSFVQCGEAGHWHPPLENVVDLLGKTSLREFVRLMHFADGVLCPVTFAMHLAAAVPLRNEGPPNRACVVVAGGREPPHWEAYPQHQYLHTLGQLECCATGGCWKSRCQPVGDGDDKDRRNRCERPVQVREDLAIPQCMELVTPQAVIVSIEQILAGWRLAQPRPYRTVLADIPRALNHSHATPRNGHVSRPLRRLRIEFRHGLGDAIQFTAVLKHLRHYHPDWELEVASLRGKHSAFHGLCQQSVLLDDPRPVEAACDRVDRLDWDESRIADGRWPNTKVTRCLQEIYRLTPIPELCRYAVQIGDEARTAARSYLESVCGPPDVDGRYRAVLIHYEGNTSGDKKNLPLDAIRDVCREILQRQHVPVILDWDRRSPLPDDRRIFCPGADHPLWGEHRTGDAERLAALIDSARLMLGIDSGPLHVAGATTTPTLGVWTHHHPLNFFDLAANVTHLVPPEHGRLVRSAAALDYFQKAYAHAVYRDLRSDLVAQVAARLPARPVPPPPESLTDGKTLRSRSYHREYYDEHRQLGLDYLSYGQWQRRYGSWLVDSFGWNGKRLLDVGCACGAIVRGLRRAGAVAQGVDLNQHMIGLGRQRWPELADALHVCDAVNLHLYADDSFDAIHSAQVAEHWRPDLVPHILAELRRVTVPGGLFFCCLDTEELFARQGRQLADEDPTHICVRPREWWDRQLAAAGWEVVTPDYLGPLQDHAETFLKEYDWDWFVARRPVVVTAAVSPAGTAPAAEPDLERVAPIFVTGMPRSGTTFLQHLLSQHPRIAIHGQEPRGVEWNWWLELLEDGLEVSRTSNATLGYDVPHYAGRLDLATTRWEFLQFVRRYLIGRETRPRWGVKSLHSCRKAVNSLLAVWPATRWIVCLRDPFRQIESLRNTYEREMPLAQLVAWWLDVAEFSQACPAAFVVCIDQLTEPEQRQAWLRSLLEFVGEAATPEILKYVADWPVIHEAVPHHRRAFSLSAAEREELLQQYPALAEWRVRLGYGEFLAHERNGAAV